ncbi:MAG TPA: phage baseplate assembly protein V [Reyranella sp.]|nr:phage baseplate assembly protein V [Reyranella sp.]
MSDQATRGLEKIWRRLQMAIGRGRVTTGDDGGNVQMLQVQMPGEDVRDNTPRVAEYGFSSMPLPGCQAIVIFVAGERSNGVVIGTNDESNRPTGLAPGEVKVYTDLGQSLYFSRAGTVIDCAGLPLSILNAPSVKHDGVEIGKTHRHGGVQSGGSNTGTPV